MGQDIRRFAEETMRFLSALSRLDGILFYVVDESVDVPVFMSIGIMDSLMGTYLESAREFDPFNSRRAMTSRSFIELTSPAAKGMVGGDCYMEFFRSNGFAEIVELFLRDGTCQLRGGMSIPIPMAKHGSDVIERVVSIANDCHSFIQYNFINQFSTLDGSRAVDQLKSYQLSKREMQVAQLIIDGRTNQDISDALFISLATVKSHVNNIFEKTQVHSRTALAAKIITQHCH